jgi:hypothetical protein
MTSSAITRRRLRLKTFTTSQYTSTTCTTKAINKLRSPSTRSTYKYGTLLAKKPIGVLTVFIIKGVRDVSSSMI